MNLEKCPCGQRRNLSSFMISCDTCCQWYHGQCVGLFNIRGFNWDSITWHCQICRLQQGEQLSMVLRRSLQLESEMFSLGSRLFTAFNDDKVKHLENQLSSLQTQMKELQEKQKDPKPSSEELVAGKKDAGATNRDKIESFENQLRMLQEQMKELQEKETVLQPLNIEPADTQNTGSTHNLIINMAKNKKEQKGERKKDSRLSLKNKEGFSSSQGSRCKTSSWVQEVKENSNDLSDDDFQPPKRNKVHCSQP